MAEVAALEASKDLEASTLAQEAPMPNSKSSKSLNQKRHLKTPK